MKRTLSFVFLLSLLVTACNVQPTRTSPEQVDEPTLAPYPDTPSPPKINAPLIESPALLTIQFFNSLDGWGVTETQIVRTNDGGITWYNVTPKNVAEAGYNIGFHALDVSHAWMQIPDFENYPNSGILYRTVDGGITWASNSDPFSMANLSFLDADNGWVMAGLGVAAGSNAVGIYQSTDGGATWTQTYTNDPNNAQAEDSLPLGGLKSGIVPLNMQTAWVYGVIYSSGTVYLFRTDDGGANWREVSLPLPAGAENFELSIDAGQMKFVSVNDGFIVVRFTGEIYQAAVYVTHDAGDTWTLTPTPIPNGGSVDFLSAEEAIIYNGDQFYVTRDAADTWMGVPPDVKFGDTFAVMDFISPSTGWVVTLDPTNNHRSLYRTGDGGATWFPIIP